MIKELNFLHLVRSEGHFETVEYLLKKKVDKNSKDRWNNTPLDDIKIYKSNLENNTSDNSNNLDIANKNKKLM